VLRPLDIRIPFLFGVITPEFRPPSAATLAAADALMHAAAEILPDFVLHDAGQHSAILQALYGEADDTLNPTEEPAT